MFSSIYFVVELLVTSDITYSSLETLGRKTKAGIDPVNALGLAISILAGVVPSTKVDAEDKY